MSNASREFDPSERLLEIAEQFAQQLRDDDQPTINQYAELYPETADEIRRYLPLLVSMEQATAHASDKTSPTTGTLPIQPGRLPIGLSRYHLRELLGQGAMGAVYKAQDLDLDRTVALKMPQWRVPDQSAIDRFYREARAMATVDHRNICSIFDVSEVQAEDIDDESLEHLVGRPYLTMAFIEGPNLCDLIKERTWTPTEAAELVLKTTSALQAAHEAGVVHRDIKPGNIVIDTQGEPIVMDFGLARRDVTEEVDITLDGQIIGSPAYMSPEQINCHRKLGPSTDIYSLGVVLYELVCGQRPFTGTRLTLLRDVCWTEPPRPKELNSDLDSGIEAICMKALAKEPADRYANAKQFADDLRTYLLAAPDSQLIAPRVRRKRSSQGMFAIGLMACLALLAVLAVSYPKWAGTATSNGDGGGTQSSGVKSVPYVAPEPTISTDEFQHRIQLGLCELLKVRNYQRRGQDVSSTFEAVFADLGITRDVTSPPELHSIAAQLSPEVQSDIHIGLEGWLTCKLRETEGVPEPWLRLLLEKNYAHQTPLRNAMLEMKIERLPALIDQYPPDQYDPRMITIWGLYLKNIERKLNKGFSKEVRKTLLARAVEVYPEDPWVNASMGLLKRESQAHIAVIKHLNIATQELRFPSLLSHLAASHLAKNQPAEAEICLTASSELDADYGTTDLVWARLKIREQDFVAAEHFTRAAIKKHCGTIEQAHTLLFQSLWCQDKHDEAMQVASAAASEFFEKEEWRRSLRVSRSALDHIENTMGEQKHVYHRYKLVSESFAAAAKLNQVGAVKKYAKRVLTDLKEIEDPSSWRAQKLKKIINTKHSRRK